MKQYPSQARLRELFDYDPGGFLVWRYNPNKRACINSRDEGRIAGSYTFIERKQSYEYSIKMNIGGREKYMSGHALIWIWHGKDIPENCNVYKKDWHLPPKIENLYCESHEKRKVRPAIRGQSGKYKGVWKNEKWSKSWSCIDLNGCEFYFPSECYAATHYDNVCEEKHGDRPNQTKPLNVLSLRITKAVAKYIQTAKASIDKRGVVGVYKGRKRFQARFAKSNLGTFDTKEKAARAYNIAAHEHYGENAVLNDIPDPLGKGDVF